MALPLQYKKRHYPLVSLLVKSFHDILPRALDLRLSKTQLCCN